MRLHRIFTRLSTIVAFARSTTAFSLGQTHQTAAAIATRELATCRAMEDSQEENGEKVLRMLVLHGSGSSGQDFTGRLGSYRDSLMEEHNTKLDITSIDAPVPKDGGGLAWWSMPPYARSYNATRYEKFETSSEMVLKTLQQAQEPFDVIYGHSQGAILTTALLALNRFPSHPARGYILNGVAWPNPYSKELDSLKFSEGSSKPRILLVTGTDDDINPQDTQERVKSSLEKAGAQVLQIKHAGGHNIPMKRDDTLRQIIDWILQ